MTARHIGHDALFDRGAQGLCVELAVEVNMLVNYTENDGICIPVPVASASTKGMTSLLKAV
jgi:hypothetical protein